MVTVIIFNSGVVATKKTNMPCCGTCLDLALISFSGLTQPYICDDVRNAITYERPLPAGYAFTRERSERVVSANTLSRNSHEEHATSGNVRQKNSSRREHRLRSNLVRAL